MITKIIVGAAILGAVTTATPEPAQPSLHLRLTASNPAKDTVMTVPPAQISLWFSEAPELKVSRVSLSGPSGTIKVAKVVRDTKNDKLLTAKVMGPITDGKYEISWITASDDGHAIKGKIPFQVNTTD